VGGDFFDLIELDENRAGILIADVMGHGARSALVTAILRALVRNHTTQAGDPGAFLTEINLHLHEVISRSGQTLFVTAFLLVLDTRQGTAKWSVAGHPAPLRVRRGSGRLPEPLWNEPHHQPALGLSTKAVYQTHESGLRAGDVFLIFTDGAFEAENPEGGIFGVDRLARSFDEALDGPMAAMPAKIVCDVTAFQRRQNYDDDVCIVAVEAVSGKAPA
jgi:serine phosphatase RsbU (regulator of sigma subunit)